LRDAGNGRATPSRRIVSGPIIRTSTPPPAPLQPVRSDSLGVSTPATTLASTPGHYQRNRRLRHEVAPQPGPAVDSTAQARVERLSKRRRSMVTTTAAARQSSPPAQPDPGQPDLGAVKTRQQGAWSSGDYAVVGTTLQIVGEALCEALDLRAGQKVLDVAAGNGNVSLAAARRWCDVVATDYVPELLQRARERAEAERLGMVFRQADAEALPFADQSFDVVVSTFGVCSPDQRRPPRRCCGLPARRQDRAGQLDADGFIGQLFRHRPASAAPASEVAGARHEPAPAACSAGAGSSPRRAASLSSLSLPAALAGDLQDLLRGS
jgi:2-polyprenyl-3-methyl-5-hydroxy-6-metoxy-1,4-benzoquinol methylase